MGSYSYWFQIDIKIVNKRGIRTNFENARHYSSCCHFSFIQFENFFAENIWRKKMFVLKNNSIISFFSFVTAHLPRFNLASCFRPRKFFQIFGSFTRIWTSWSCMHLGQTIRSCCFNDIRNNPSYMARDEIRSKKKNEIRIGDSMI